eukprot:CAMPEP_0176345508 /NCGR_PEP_ID=MMETSP0126-20121128/5509_1 /TAXON_ID=141414 ORGANISM="Strombidinopsis acuminatum, Strain SPMC142" /NCGR_SAMPLE_ID=MMETSP0126 /ASSEMBLY_ACC=CAM_ASM_000229 /LENGTH=53 /DNA_ID=CAMNT_0017692517 /DNA_START=804 /DNA_END=965 /DNA_ORIENTATION=+
MQGKNFLRTETNRSMGRYFKRQDTAMTDVLSEHTAALMNPEGIVTPISNEDKR